MAAVVLLYGLLTNPSDLERFSQTISDVVPPDVAVLLDRQIRRLVDQQDESGRSLLRSLAWIAFVIVSANRGMQGVIDALSKIYDRTEKRALLTKFAVTMIMTIGMIVFVAVSVFAILLLPVVLNLLTTDASTLPRIDLFRWPALFILAVAATSLLLRFGPHRATSYWPYILVSSTISAVLWLGMSVSFSWYAQNLGSFSALYGSLGSVVAFMIWLWLSALTVLLGAELDVALNWVKDEQRCAVHRKTPDTGRTVAR